MHKTNQSGLYVRTYNSKSAFLLLPVTSSFLSGLTSDNTRPKGMIRQWTLDKSHKTDPIWCKYLHFALVALSALTAPADNYTRPKGSSAEYD